MLLFEYVTLCKVAACHFQACNWQLLVCGCSKLKVKDFPDFVFLGPAITWLQVKRRKLIKPQRGSFSTISQCNSACAFFLGSVSSLLNRSIMSQPGDAQTSTSLLEVLILFRNHYTYAVFESIRVVSSASSNLLASTDHNA